MKTSHELRVEEKKRMGLGKTLVQRITKRMSTRVMDRLGGLLMLITDTSSDAPSSFTAPKRNYTGNAPEADDPPSGEGDGNGQ